MGKQTLDTELEAAWFNTERHSSGGLLCVANNAGGDLSQAL